MNTDPEQYAGDEPLYCHIGQHAYTLDRCRYCDRRNPTELTYKQAPD